MFCHQCCRHVPTVMMTRLPTKSAQDPGPSSGGGSWMSRRRRRRDHHIEQRFQEVIVDDSFASESSTGGLLVLPTAKRPSSVRWRSSARTPTPPSVTAARPGFIFMQHLRGFRPVLAFVTLLFVHASTNATHDHNIPRCLPKILTVPKFWYHLAHSFSHKNVPFDFERAF